LILEYVSVRVDALRGEGWQGPLDPAIQRGIWSHTPEMWKAQRQAEITAFLDWARRQGEAVTGLDNRSLPICGFVPA
jgi:hypothetical protein